MTFEQWWDTTAKTPAPDTFKRWEESCRQAWVAGAAQAVADPRKALESRPETYATEAEGDAYTDGWFDSERHYKALQPADPMDWPLPCDVTVGHGTMRKGVKLRTLVLRMKSLYEMATGENADEVAGRSLGERKAMLGAWQAQVDDGWRLVPIEPTIAMLANAERVLDKWKWQSLDPSVYHAMLSAAPVCDSVQVDHSEDSLEIVDLAAEPIDMVKELREMAQLLVETADEAGRFITIERRPLLPLSMGHTEPVVTVWRKRGVS